MSCYLWKCQHGLITFTPGLAPQVLQPTKKLFENNFRALFVNHEHFVLVIYEQSLTIRTL
jgi:hypothetical protein